MSTHPPPIQKKAPEPLAGTNAPKIVARTAPDASLSLHDAQAIAQSIVSVAQWRGAEAWCECPGKSLHTNPDSKRDCTVYLDRVPTVHCVHTSCAGAIETANYRLRSALGKRVSSALVYIPTGSESAERVRRQAERDAAAQLSANAQASRDEILRRWEWSEVDAWEASPLRLDGLPEKDWRHHLSLFTRDSVVWIGDERDTGSPMKSTHFRRVDEWLATKPPAGSFTCASVFKTGCHSRSTDNVIATPFLIVEGDVVAPICALKKARADARKAEGLPIDPANDFTIEDKESNRVACMAVIRWLREAVELRLVAIVDAANKSCHGWFEMPPESVVMELRTILPHLGCDAAMFKASQPARLAGVKRGQRWQRLLFCELSTWRDAPR